MRYYEIDCKGIFFSSNMATHIAQKSGYRLIDDEGRVYCNWNCD